MTILKRYNGSDWEAIAVGQKGDSGVGVPTGGTTDQVLAKVSATDYDTAWVTLNYVDAAGAVSAIKADADWNATDWDTAYGWGDHAVAGYALSSSLGTIASQDANSVNIDGGAIDATDIGVTTPATVSSDNYLTADNYPTIKPSLNLDFANTKTLDPRVTFARASTATYYDGQTVAKAEENLALHSGDLTNPYWQLSRATVALDALETSPTESDVFTLTQSATETNGGVIARNGLANAPGFYSVYAKYIDQAWIRILTAAGDNSWFDIQNGTIGTTDANHNCSIVNAGGGWYRIVVEILSGGVNPHIYMADANNSTTSALSANYHITSPQFEQRDSVTAYTPTTTQPITNYIPVLQTAASGDPRFDHDPITGESKGLLIEEQRTNLLTYSEDFSSVWLGARAIIETNAIVAPDGTLTGDKFIATSDSGTHITRQNPSVTSGTTYTLSLYAKKAEYQYLRLEGANALGDKGATFNLNDGSVESADVGATASISDAGNGWYRCVVSVTATSTSTGGLYPYLVDNSLQTTFTGDDFSGIYIWGAQQEAGSFPTSYIKTEGSQVTRVADSASMTGTNFSDWYRPDEGTLYTDVAENSIDAAGAVFDLYGASVQRVESYYRSPSNGVVFVKDNGTNQAIFNADQAFGKRALALAKNDVAASLDGSAVLTDTSCTIPLASSLYIGSIESGSVQLNRCIKRLAYYPQRLSNLELVALTEE